MAVLEMPMLDDIGPGNVIICFFQVCKDFSRSIILYLVVVGKIHGKGALPWERERTSVEYPNIFVRGALA